MLIGFLPARFARLLGQAQSIRKVSVFRQWVGFNRVQIRHFEASKKTTVRSLRESKATDFDAKGYILLVVPLTAFLLGTWQIQRRKWKIGLIRELEKRTKATPIPLPADLNELEDLEYRRVVVRGHFDHSKELHVSPRSPVAGTEPEIGGSDADKRLQRAMSQINKSGANIVTAFVIDDPEHRGMRVLVNRGWVPREKLNASTRKEGQIDDNIDLTGVVRHNERRQQFSPPNEPNANQWFSRDINAMSEVLDTVPVFLDADKKSTVRGGPYGGQTIVTLRNEHLSYIFTWYSLSAFTFYMWMRLFLRK